MTESGRSTDCELQGARAGPYVQGFGGGADRQEGCWGHTSLLQMTTQQLVGVRREQDQTEKRQMSGERLANLKHLSLAVEGRVPTN